MKNRTLLLLAAVIVTMFGFAYASVPLYRLFCQVTGYGGTPKIYNTINDYYSKSTDELVRVRLDSGVSHQLPLKFHPMPPTWLDVNVGDPVLAFYQVTNCSDGVIRGIATYNIVPQEAAVYFNKIQCFCFEEQQLQRGETIEMPVLFFIHPDILQSSFRNVTLSYTFFASVSS